jgi:RNA polymerase sigma-70 factor (ECF subfamily)
MRAEVAAGEPVELEYQHAYERFSRDVFRFLLAWTNDWAAAEDLTQETYLRLWQHRASINWSQPILGWLFVTARHLASNRFRGLGRRRGGAAPPEPAEESARVRWLDVRAALVTLSPLERTALILTAVEGWSYAEVAQAIQTTEGALRAAVSRARDKLEVA